MQGPNISLYVYLLEKNVRQIYHELQIILIKFQMIIYLITYDMNIEIFAK